MIKKWKTLLITSIMIFGVITGAVVTYALLSSVTQTATNVFASDRDIGIILSEPEWEDHGKAEAAAYVPGQTIDKDPTIALKQNSVSSYVALCVKYYDENDKEISFKSFEKKYLNKEDNNRKAGLDFSDSWSFIGSQNGELSDEKDEYGKSVVYMYNNILTQDNAETQRSVTVPLFTKVHLNQKITIDQKTKLLPKFNIKVTAYAVQSEGITVEEAKEELYKMAAEKN